VNWVAGDEVFEDCDGRRYPPSGEGLRQYPVTVEDGRLRIDLRRS
jgi:hypothetical protein